MQEGFLVGLDVGGSGGRCALLKTTDGSLHTSYCAWQHPRADAGVWSFDLDTDRVWHSLGQLVQTALRGSGASASEVLGISVTGMRHGFVLADVEGTPLLALPYQDARAVTQSMDLGRERGDEVYSRTGHFPSPICAAARLLWVAEHHPEQLERAHAILAISDWVAYRLTGQFVTDPSLSGETSLCEIQERKWAWDLMDSFGLPRRLLPRLLEPGSPCGALTPSAAAHLGLAAGTPVAVGGADAQCGLLGTATIEPGEACILAGSSAPVQLVLDRPRIDSGEELWLGHHVLPNRWVLESNCGCLGSALEWIAGVLYGDGPQPVARLIAEAALSSPGAAGILSSFGVDVFNARHLQLPMGDLTLSPMMASADPARRPHVARAILEGLTFGVRANLDQLRERAGVERPVLRVAGGLSQNSFWVQMLSNVCGLPVSAADSPHASATGAAICAGVGAGVYRSAADGARALVRLTRNHTPHSEDQQTYEDLYVAWRQWRHAGEAARALAGDLTLEKITTDAGPSGLALKPICKPRILVTASMDPQSLEELRRLGEVRYSCYRDDMRLLAGDDLVDELQGFQVLVTEVDVLSAEALERLPDLRVVVSCRGNAVNIDTQACTDFGVPVLHTPGRNADAVADLTVAFLLSLARDLPAAGEFLRQGDGDAGDMARMGAAHARFQGQELWRKTVGLVGLGRVGEGVAKRLKPFGVRVLTYDPVLQAEAALLAGAESVSLRTLLEESDFVSLHAAVTDASRGLIGRREFEAMKSGSYLVNTARAELVDEEALAQALSSGHLGGAALDVFAVEPPGADHPLLAFSNVVATPHVGGNTTDVAAHQGAMVVEGLSRLVREEKPEHVLNAATLDGFSWLEARRRVPSDGVVNTRPSLPPKVCDFRTEEPVPKVCDVPTKEPAPDVKSPLKSEEQSKKQSSTPGRARGVFGGLRDFLGGRSRKAPTSVPTKTLSPASPESVEKLEGILRGFLKRAVKDQALRKFARGKQITVHYDVTDMGLSFYTRFEDGRVEGALGEPDRPAEVRLKMRAQVLDGVFTDRLNGTKAALTGKLAFSGDTIKAIALKRIQSDFNRLYIAAREEAGGFDEVAATTESESSPRPGPLSSAAPTEAATPPDERDEMVLALEELYREELVTSTGGNVSLRVPGSQSDLWITPSQLHKGRLSRDLMVRIDMEGQPRGPGSGTPSSEHLIHASILKARPDVEAVIHSHAPQATVLALAELPFLPISTEAAFVGELPRVPFLLPGSRDLAESVVEALGKSVAVLMQNHGLVVAGSTLRRALDLTLVIEHTAESLVACHRLGREPSVIPDHIAAELREVGVMMG
jgi:sugar (pentulose or hexulose) kinase/phosphoglycerate dehydrogenase-like enzyme/ribulose-5-phosphate 4-epimerase/fuculose-1-phosphate aldolase/putative sterol carrier protein